MSWTVPQGQAVDLHILTAELDVVVHADPNESPDRHPHQVVSTGLDELVALIDSYPGNCRGEIFLYFHKMATLPQIIDRHR